jgi:hypothetical protein
MSVCGERSCAECPALNFIDRQSEKSQSARADILAAALRAMGLADEINTASDVSLLKYYEDRVADLKVTYSNIFAGLDSADAMLQQTRVELKEACPSGQPYITYETGPLGRRVLRCASELAVDLPDIITSAVLPDAE